MVAINQLIDQSINQYLSTDWSIHQSISCTSKWGMLSIQQCLCGKQKPTFATVLWTSRLQSLSLSFFLFIFFEVKNLRAYWVKTVIPKNIKFAIHKFMTYDNLFGYNHFDNNLDAHFRTYSVVHTLLHHTQDYIYYVSLQSSDAVSPFIIISTSSQGTVPFQWKERPWCNQLCSLILH